MGQKDLSEKNLEFFPDVFADLINALLYEGKTVLDAGSLQPAPTETLYKAQSAKLRNQFHDVSKYHMKDGKIHLQYTLENETKANRKMIFRKIGYEGAVYREQFDRKGEFPFIGLVLYWGHKKWNYPRSIREYFSPRDIPLATWKYINRFNMPIFQMTRLPKNIRNHFKSDMRIIVDYLAEGEKYVPTRQPILHVEAFALMMKNLTDNEEYEKMIPQLLEDESKGEPITMVDLLAKYKDEGMREGMSLGVTRGISQGISQGISRGVLMSVENIMRNLSLELAQACAAVGTTVEEYREAKKAQQHFSE